MPQPFVNDERITESFRSGYSFQQLAYGKYDVLQCPIPDKLPKNYVMVEKPYSLQRVIQIQDAYEYPDPTYPNYWYSGLVGFPNNDLPGLDNNDLIKLYNGYVKKFANHDFDAGIFLGEGRQTIGLVTSTATRIAKAITAVRYGNLSMAKDVLLDRNQIDFRRINKDFKIYRKKLKRSMPQKVWASTDEISKAWLELQYGWKPLLGDVHSSMQALSSRLNTRYDTRVRHFVQRLEQKTLPDGSVLFRHHFIKLTGSISSTPSLTHSLNLTDPFNVAWELVPYSFVVDWFIPIGDFLSLAGKLRHNDYGTITKSEFMRDRRIGKGPFESESYLDSYDFRRDVSFQMPVVPPLPSFKRLEKALSPLHLVNALALLRRSVR
jgi:hypothetical protein